jgi:hypothetical protein
MKKPDDKIIYIAFIAATLAAALFFGGISLYSRMSVEPNALALLENAGEDFSKLNEAYIILRDPQLFAGYKYWDSDGIPARNTLRYFDNKIFNGKDIIPAEKPYLNILLQRRIAGSTLGIKTAFFFLGFAFIGAVAFFIYRRGVRD